jgi:hypothetical protein
MYEYELRLFDTKDSNSELARTENDQVITSKVSYKQVPCSILIS